MAFCFIKGQTKCTTQMYVTFVLRTPGYFLPENLLGEDMLE